MPNIDPTIRFWIGFAVTAALLISNGSLLLHNMMPDTAIPYVVAWCGFTGTIGTAFLTALNGLAATNQSRLASAASIPEVKTIVTTDKAMADAAGPKVVSP